jgi:hypothetical protein
VIGLTTHITLILKLKPGSDPQVAEAKISSIVKPLPETATGKKPYQ